MYVGVNRFVGLLCFNTLRHFEAVHICITFVDYYVGCNNVGCYAACGWNKDTAA